MAIKRRMSASNLVNGLAKITRFHNRVIHRFCYTILICMDNFTIGTTPEVVQLFIYLWSCALLYFYSTIRFVVNLPTICVCIQFGYYYPLPIALIASLVNSGCVMSIRPSMVKCLEWNPIYENTIIVKKREALMPLSLQIVIHSPLNFY